MKSGWIYYMPIHLLGLLMIIIDDCSWSNNPCIMTVDKRSIKIYIVQKTIPLWLEGIWKWPWSTWTMDLIIILNSWGEFIIHEYITFVKVHWYSPCKRKSPLYVSHEIIIISIALLRGACTHWEWNYDTPQCGWEFLSHKFIYEST